MIALHAWPGGLAIVVEAHARRVAAVLGPDGWRGGEPGAVLPEGPPAGAESVFLRLPAWLVEQLAALEIDLGGAHTEFVRLDRLMARMQADGRDGAMIVLGRQPAAVVLSGGTPHIIEPDVPAGAPVMPVLAAASGWIIVFSGKVAMPTPPVQAPATEAQAPTDERFVVASHIARAVPDDVAEAIKAAAGEPALAVVAQLDGVRSIAEIAKGTGLTAAQVTTVVKLLAARKLAFRYVSRVRPPTGARTSG
ncbi:MAG: hypothetical protein A2Z07_02105 [Armatimonadetes bacterium RBG_16_67_12]|nr:MAG: hypothetical protein A2Z07_02105 [Armatimonadetes bacterium RBG_16_67_12]